MSKKALYSIATPHIQLYKHVAQMTCALSLQMISDYLQHHGTHVQVQNCCCHD